MAELYPEARKLIETVRAARTPSQEDRERVFASLMANVALGAAVPSVAAAKSGLLGKLASNALWVKAAATVTVISAASVSTIAYVRHRENAVGAAPHLAPAVTQAVRVPASVAPEVVPAPPPVTPALPAVAVPVERPSRVVTSPRLTADAPSAEIALLRQARDARRAGQPERALELARDHAEKYPHSERWAERETVRVLALCDLGRVEAARRAAAPLQYLWSSPERATLNASCVGK